LLYDLFVQVIPGDAADRLWFAIGDDVAWLPLPGKTRLETTDDTFRFTHEGVLETGWIIGSDATWQSSTPPSRRTPNG